MLSTVFIIVVDVCICKMLFDIISLNIHLGVFFETIRTHE